MDFIPSERIVEEREIFQRLLDGGVVENYETQRRHKNGTLIDVMMTASPIKDEAGRVVGVSKIVRDVTRERSARQKQLQALRAEVAQLLRLNTVAIMAASISHDLSQPLTAAMNFVCAARHSLDDAEAAKQAGELLDQAVDEIKHCSAVIRSVREFLGKRGRTRTEESINEIIVEALRLNLPSWTIDMRVVSEELSLGLPPVNVDKVQIEQVVLNLMRNSYEAMPRDGSGSIILRTERAGPDFVRVSVIDTGSGVAPEIAERLFQPFNTTKSAGMGIGLSICRSVVESHGGKISAEPNEPRGTVFSFTLPVVNTADV